MNNWRNGYVWYGSNICTHAVHLYRKSTPSKEENRLGRWSGKGECVVTNDTQLFHFFLLGTTWHTAGLMHGLARSEVDFLLRQKTRQILNRLEDETGVNTGWIMNGSLLVSSTRVHTSDKGSHALLFIFGLVTVNVPRLSVCVCMRRGVPYHWAAFLLWSVTVILHLKLWPSHSAHREEWDEAMQLYLIASSLLLLLVVVTMIMMVIMMMIIHDRATQK